MDNIATQILNFCNKEIPILISQLEKNRFANQGRFNDHEQWVDNQSGYRRGSAYFQGKKYPKKTVQQDKGRNEPLVDSGRLKNELSTASNWDLTPQFSNNELTLTIPDNEQFTDAVYDKLEFKHKGEAYISARGNLVHPREIPARPFKAFSDQDIDWIIDQLIIAIKDEFE